MAKRQARKDKRVDEQRKPRVDATARPKGGKTPRMQRKFNPTDPAGKVVVQFGRFDVGSEWCLSQVESEELRTVLQRIGAIETMTVREAFNNQDEPGKDYSVADLPTKAARERLIHLKYDDEDQISRLRVSGTGRLYGFRRNERFYALWWDPQHNIWPSPKKRT